MMATGCMVLTCMLLFQMAAILIMLNPIYDAKKLTQFINDTTKHYRRTYIFLIAFYFTSILYLGMYLPLQSVHTLIFSNHLLDYDKLNLLHSIEKNYITAGFSLFLVVVLYGVRALLAYTASLPKYTDNRGLSVQFHQGLPVPVHHDRPKNHVVNANILPKVLRVKRSISFETVLFTNELREKLKLLIKNANPNEKSALVSILEAKQVPLS